MAGCSSNPKPAASIQQEGRYWGHILCTLAAGGSLVLLLWLALTRCPTHLLSSSPASDTSTLLRVYLPIVHNPPGWYKVRLCITTTSDWSSVVLTGTARILNSGLVEARGGYPRDGGMRTVLMTQDLRDALRGTQVYVAKDWALTDLGQSLLIQITRGDLGWTQVEVWNASSAQPTLVQTMTWSGLNSLSNLYTFAVDARRITASGRCLRSPDEISADAWRFFDQTHLQNLQLPTMSSQLHRAYITFTTSSDWTDLFCTAGLDVSMVRQLHTLGRPTLAESRYDVFWLRQSLSQAQAGITVGLAAQLVFTPCLGAKRAEFVLAKGHIGTSKVEICNHNAASPVTVQSVTHAGVASATDPRNPLTFTVSLPGLTASGPLVAPLPALPKMLWAFYYLWYDLSSWNSPILQDTPALRYRSDDVQALSRHIQQAQNAGIDGFAASWWGPGDYTDANLQLLLNAASPRGFKVIAYLETLDYNSRPRSESELQRWLEYLLRQYGQHPAYYRWDSRPVVVVWASATVPLESWQRIFASLRAQGLNAHYIALDWNPTILSEFSGVHQYGVGGQYQLGALYQRAALGVRGYALLYPESGPKLWTATLQPGYDERTIPGRAGWYWERWDGDTYRYTFEAALKSAPDWLFITSWNEWWEHTYIEPSMRYGDLYLRLTREFAAQWKQ